MADQTFFPISELSTYHAKWVIRARVTQKTQLRSFASKREAGGASTQVFDCHLLDESGIEISASFFGGVADKYYPLIQQGKCYTFSRGGVRIANRQYNRCAHRYQLTFDKDALIEEAADVASIETVKYTFTDLHAVQAKSLPCSVDLVGVVTAVRPVRPLTSKDGKELVKRDITIADDTSTSMTVTLWGERAQREDKDFEGHPVISFKGVALREWNGGRSGSLSDSGSMELSPKLSEAQRLQQWWAQHGSTTSLTSLSSTIAQEGRIDLKTLQSKTLPCTVDIVGIVTAAKPTFAFTSKDGRELVKREVTVADDSATSMTVALWGERAKQEDKAFEGQPVVSLRGVIVREFNGARSGSLTEAGVMELSPASPEAQRLKEWYTQHASSTSFASLSMSMSQEGLVDLRSLQSKALPCTVDLCGVVASFKPTFAFTSQAGKELVKREITIVDATGCSMGVTLWGDRAQQDDKFFDNNAVVGIKGVIVKEWNDGRSGSLLEAGALVFEPSTPEAQHVRDWWSQGGSSQGITALSTEGAGGAGGARRASAKACTVAEMRSAAAQVSGSQPETYGLVCRLALVQMQKQGETQALYYTACMEAKPENGLPCNKRYGEDGFCAGCNRQVSKSAPRLNLRCRFSDYGDSAWLGTFHEPAQQVLAKSAEDVKAMELGPDGRDALEAAVRSRYFAEPLQVTVRAKLDSYNGEPRANVSCVDARPVNRGVHGRAMLKSIQDMLGSEPVAAC